MVNKETLVSEIAEKTGLTKKVIRQVIEPMFEIIIDDVKRGEEVAIQGFGKFEISERKPRDLKVPNTGETMHIDGYKTPKFRAGAYFKQALKEV